LIAALTLASACAAAGPLARGSSYLLSRQQPDGGFAEPGSASSVGLTAWVVLGLAASGHDPAKASKDGHSAIDYLAGSTTKSATDIELRLLALDALGQNTSQLANRIEHLRRPSGQIGPAFNSTFWGAIALRAAGHRPGAATVRFILRMQRASGGWSWSISAAPDAGDTAAAIEALRAAGTSARSKSVRLAVRFLRRCQNRDGGFAVAPGRDSDAQTTAWAIQGLLAAHTAPGKPAFRYLARLERPNGSFRYSARYVTTPTWVTAQALSAIARKPFPLS
jgi:prenyltransferase beta subunit